MRVLVTGRAGQVGAEVARALQGFAEVIAHDRSTLDLADPDQVVARVREARPDAIVNAAAYTAVDQAESDAESARRVNAIGPGVLAEEARRAGAVLIHYSTDYVFDGTKAAPYVETDATNPLGAYGRTKLEGERAIAASGCDHVILRTSWVYGPHGRNFLLTMLRLAAQRDELRVVDDQRGAPTSSAQLGRLTRALLAREPALREKAGIYHATAAGETTWRRFAEAIFDGARRRASPAFRVPRVIPITTAEYPTPARRPANSLLSNAKLGAAFGLAIGEWREGLDEALSALPLESAGR
ncbi:MAG TPA: dTDP-4-dehydrorhamnose reductase [Usitatibacter sp.]|nr:dTDP-4-dehydrorhamnose reductase [Usitatibacter sp.]